MSKDQPTPVATGILDDLAASPTPYHAVERSAALLADAGFTEVDSHGSFPTEPGGRYLISGGSLIAWWQGPLSAFRIVGAHTDSPNLRVRTHPEVTSGGFSQVGMEVYGGVLLNSWLDRDLGLAGRVVIRRNDGAIDTQLFLDDSPVLRIPQLAIHLDREIREKGLKLDPQRHLTPLWALAGDDGEEVDVKGHVASGLDVDPEHILSWDLMVFDTQPPAIVGRDRDLFASGRIDNLVSAFCGVRALISATTESGAQSEDGPLPVLALYDHEEIGSESATGAAGQLLSATLERIAAASGADRPDYLAALASSLVISADGAHATNPNYVDKHEPSHHIALNEGVVVKRNANQRYATDAASEAIVVAAAADAKVPLQYYIHRNDLPCGSTIGPITAARLGVSTVDLGAPQLAMHSAREMAGLRDLDYLNDLLAYCWRP